MLELHLAMKDKITPVTKEDEVLREFGDNLVRTDEGVMAGFKAKKVRHQSGSMVAAKDFKATACLHMTDDVMGHPDD